MKQYTDTVANTYLQMKLNEMAMYRGDMSEDNSLLSNSDDRNKFYHEMKNLPLEKDYGDGISLHKNKEENKTEYRTLDHKNKEFVHFSDFIEDHSNTNLPFPHQYQKSVQKYDKSRLPKGYAEDVTYHHFTTSDLPLKSDKEQYTGGKILWNRLVNRALKDGHHVYFHDGNKLHDVTAENKEHALSSYIGTRGSFMFKHLILSKRKLQ